MIMCSNTMEKQININFNNDWLFCKINDSTTNAKQIKNQGASWESQFNIEHIQVNDELFITQKVLSKENEILQKANWDKVTLPHWANIEPLTVKHQWQGVCYYRKNFSFDQNLKSKQVYLEFEAAMQVADVWLNGKHICHHEGGYTPFVININDYLLKNNEILIRLDNNNNPTVPPGKPLESLDFCYFSGIHRNVNLYVNNNIHITNPNYIEIPDGGGVFVTYSEVSEEIAKIEIKTNFINKNKNDENCIVVQKLFDSNNELIKKITSKNILIKNNQNRTVTQKIKLENPKLWTPENPQLYQLETQLVRNNSIVDSKTTKIGIKRIAYSREHGFTINNKSLRLIGTNRHSEYPYIGNAISDNAQYRDLYKIKKAGFNTVRLGHYPQSPSVLDACDELGLLVIEPIPGWQFFNKSEKFCQLTYQSIRDMIRRDRNHPSIIMWETILNESWPPQWWKDKANQIAHEEYPGDQCFTAGDMYGYFGWDILYNDWNENHTRPNDSKKPSFIREYGDYEFGGHYSTSRVNRGDGETKLRIAAWNHQWSHNKHRSQYPWTIGDGVWSMYDYNRGCSDNICYSGVSDIFRLPKFSYYFYRSQISWDTDLIVEQMPAMVFVANYWNSPCEKVVVYGNVDKVILFVNGKKVSEQFPDSGLDTKYADDYQGRISGGNPFDGGNCKNLKHPPFTFTDIKYKAGEIKAIGFINGMEVCQHIVKTPQKAEKIKIIIDESGKKIKENDTFFIYVNIIDKNSTLCVDNNEKISLFVNSDCEILSPVVIEAEAGIATFLLRSAKNKKIKIKAVAKQMSDEILLNIE